ncbi:MAG: hypothetical protein RLZZ631_1304 [Cyanobacteriota bacterium]
MTTSDWVTTTQMAAALGVSTRTLYEYRVATDEKAFLKEGTHFRRKTPTPNSTWLWDKERTLKAWAVALRKEVQA